MVSNETEEWRPLHGWEDSHEGSTLGRIRSLPRWIKGPHGSKRFVPGTTIKQNLSGTSARSVSKYFRVTLLSKGRKETLFVHRLIARTFLDGVGAHTRHLDGDSQNNRVFNLAFGTAQENANDAVRHGVTRRGEEHSNAKITTLQVRAVRALILAKFTYAEVSTLLGIPKTIVGDVVRRATWKHLP